MGFRAAGGAHLSHPVSWGIRRPVVGSDSRVARFGPILDSPRLGDRFDPLAVSKFRGSFGRTSCLNPCFWLSDDLHRRFRCSSYVRCRQQKVNLSECAALSGRPPVSSSARRRLRGRRVAVLSSAVVLHELPVQPSECIVPHMLVLNDLIPDFEILQVMPLHRNGVLEGGLLELPVLPSECIVPHKLVDVLPCSDFIAGVCLGANRAVEFASYDIRLDASRDPRCLPCEDVAASICGSGSSFASGLEVRAVLGTVRVAACICGSGPHFASCLEVQCESDLDADVHTAVHVSHSVVEGGDVPCGLVPLASCAESCEVHAVCDVSCMSDVSFAASEDAEGLCVGYAARDVCVESVVHAASMDAEGFCFGYAARDVCVVAGAYVHSGVPLDVLVCGEFECAGKSGAARLDDVFVEVPDVYAEVCACIAIEFCLRSVSSDVPVLVESSVVPTTDVSSPVPVEFDAGDSPVNSFPLEVSADDCSPLHGVQELQEDSDADVVRSDVERPCVGYAAGAVEVLVSSAASHPVLQEAKLHPVSSASFAATLEAEEYEEVEEFDEDEDLDYMLAAVAMDASASVSCGAEGSEGVQILGGIRDLLLKTQGSADRCRHLPNVSHIEASRLCTEIWNDFGAGLAETVPLLAQSAGLLELLHAGSRGPFDILVVLILCRVFLAFGADELVCAAGSGCYSRAGLWTRLMTTAIVQMWSRKSLWECLQRHGIDCDEDMVHLSICRDVHGVACAVVQMPWVHRR
jgi:hypothetical protein